MIKRIYNGETILVAEDDEYSFEYIRRVLRDSGLTILKAVNGEEAVSRCKMHPEIRMILMDGMMPVMTGYQAATIIHGFRPDLPVVILTAFVSTESIRDAVISGCNDYLAKPFWTEELCSIVKKWLITALPHNEKAHSDIL